ncbi:TPA: hypothetical protein ACH3X1_007842 [Trebouxia sp. C0004]
MKGNVNQDDSNHSLAEKYKAESAARQQASVQQAGSVSSTSGSLESPLPSHQPLPQSKMGNGYRAEGGKGSRQGCHPDARWQGSAHCTRESTWRVPSQAAL